MCMYEGEHSCTTVLDIFARFRRPPHNTNKKKQLTMTLLKASFRRRISFSDIYSSAAANAGAPDCGSFTLKPTHPRWLSTAYSTTTDISAARSNFSSKKSDDRICQLTDKCSAVSSLTYTYWKSRKSAIQPGST